VTVAVRAVDGGVCAAGGFTAAGVSAGLKPSGAADVALVAARDTVGAAAVQTANQVLAAPVKVTARHIANGRARAVLLNSGSANACTGPDGIALAEASADATAKLLGCPPEDVLLCSTGVIGVPIPSEPFLAAIPKAVEGLTAEGGSAAAQAIMTTDTRPKQAAVAITDDEGSCTIGGMAKGSGMIAPEMATMLCVITTDAPVAGPVLHSVLREAVEATFNRISVDGCMSTNDAVIALASGTAARTPSLKTFLAGLTQVCGELAEAIVGDGEGAAKLVRIRLRGALNAHAAAGVGRAIAGSALFRAAIAGGDPNWGRVLAAMGAGPARFDPDRVHVDFAGATVCRFGVGASYDRDQVAAAMKRREVEVVVDLNMGDSEATFLTCDLTHDYVTINAEYTT
jgi:glutamate N-acetyltransferase/amino-acid N-acetyltransferase